MRLFEHNTPTTKIENVNNKHDASLSFSDRVSDHIADFVGSWVFIAIMSGILLLWIAINSLYYLKMWDPYPFILLNLVLSFLAGYTGPFILMSQNRQAAKDRLMAENDYQSDVRSEQFLSQIIAHLDTQDKELLILQTMLDHMIDNKYTRMMQTISKDTPPPPTTGGE